MISDSYTFEDYLKDFELDYLGFDGVPDEPVSDLCSALYKGSAGQMMDKSIIEFLIKAKRATYAGKGAETSSSREKSHDLVYQDGDYMYYDTYLGTGKFAGEEALWINKNPYWSMNYIGRVTGDGFSGDFLKEALLHVPEDRPFRGPEQYSNGDYLYQCEVEGGFDWFQGKEIIHYKDTEIYECFFHGGLVE